jgi:hypothetical protein
MMTLTHLDNSSPSLTARSAHVVATPAASNLARQERSWVQIRHTLGATGERKVAEWLRTRESPATSVVWDEDIVFL